MASNLHPSRRGCIISDLATSIGLEDQHPSTRSGDLNVTDELLYMLIRRLGLVPKLRYSAALNRGSWFHRRCELFHCTSNQAHSALMPDLHGRVAELETYAEEVGCDSAKLTDRETEDYDTAFSWYDAAATVPLSQEDKVCAGVKLEAGATFRDFILHPDWIILGTEVLIALEDGTVAQIDLLLYNTKTQKLWLVDMKTTAKAAHDRLSLCPCEAQTLLYPRVVADALAYIISKFDLPRHVAIAGMLHVAVQKPDIKMCGVDRDFEYKEHVLASGPRKGQKEMRKVWMSEKPVRANYIARCADWYKGEGEYTDKAPERTAKPTVAISATPASVIFSEVRQGWFDRLIKRGRDLATRPLALENFPPNPNTLSWGKKSESPYEPFYLLDPAYWPTIIERDFKVQDRDEKTPAPPSVTVLGANPYIASKL